MINDIPPDRVVNYLLSPWEEVVGSLTKVIIDDQLSLVLVFEPKMVQVQIPKNLLVGKIPPLGTVVGILRTDIDYRIKQEIRKYSVEKRRGVDSTKTIHAPQSSLSFLGEQASGKKRRGQN